MEEYGVNFVFNRTILFWTDGSKIYTESLMIWIFLCLSSYPINAHFAEKIYATNVTAKEFSLLIRS